MTTLSRTFVLTGASDGIGAVAARTLTAQGHRVVVVGRSPVKTQALADELGAPHYVVDFADLGQVHRLARDLASAFPQIDVLANNAGAIFGGREVTVDGFEKNFQVNYLAPFLLTHSLLPQLRAGEGVVLNTSSESTVRYGKVDIADLNSERDYSDARAYANAKLNVILATKVLQRLEGPNGIKAVSFHPGNISSNFGGGSSWSKVYNSPLKYIFLVRPEKAARTFLHFLTGAPGQDWTPGEYYHLTKLSGKKTPPQAADPVLAEQLWVHTHHLLGLKPAS